MDRGAWWDTVPGIAESDKTGQLNRGTTMYNINKKQGPTLQLYSTGNYFQYLVIAYNG